MAFHASILAGGSGTRLWPLSTKKIPKQFLSLTGSGGRTMLQETVDRLTPLAPIDHTYVVTFANYRDIVQQQLPTLPPHHIIAEPIGRGTAASIGLAATFIAAQDPHGIMGSFTADHIITKAEGFRQSLQFAEQVAQNGYLVTLGIEPSYPETGYGYIEAGNLIQANTEKDIAAYQVTSFKEKPDVTTAEHYIATGKYAWNAGIFVWRVDRILDEIRQHVPTVGRVLDHIAAGIANGRTNEAIQEAWPSLTENVTIDVGVLEKSANIAVVPIDIGWNDIGNWAQMATIHNEDQDRNRVSVSHPGRHIAVNTANSFIYSTTDRIIATIGLEDVVIVDTADALLICHKDHVQSVKIVTDLL